MSLDPAMLSKADPVAKVVLAKRASRFLNSANRPDEELATVENVARALAQDICLQVRETLAFELRFCDRLPHDLAARIATDVESVSGPFIEVTTVFSDDQWAGLIPHLEEHALLRLAKRSDLGDHAALALVSSGPEKAASAVLKNIEIRLSEPVCDKTVDRFHANQPMMDTLAERSDLPLSIVERIVEIVSDSYRSVLLQKYALSEDVVRPVVTNTRAEVLWKKIETAGAAQVHGYAIDLKRDGRLDEDLVIEMASRGSFQFLGSALALEAGQTLGNVRVALESNDLRKLLELVKNAGFSKEGAQRILQLLKQNDIQFQSRRAAPVR